jgi:hypothetical protein
MIMAFFESLLEVGWSAKQTPCYIDAFVLYYLRPPTRQKRLQREPACICRYRRTLLDLPANQVKVGFPLGAVFGQLPGASDGTTIRAERGSKTLPEIER